MPKKLSTSTLTTTPDLLTVRENSAATPIGIVAPVDSLYASSRLTITVTALPSDGTVYLSDGATPVLMGQTLSIAQLTSLKFKPTSGLFGTSSTFTYRVTDPSGTAATGIATLSIAADSLPPVTTAASLTVAQNSGPTSIGIVAPGDPNYSASQLSIKVTGLPTDGAVFLSDGTTAVVSGQSLSVAQLTGLKFKPLAGAFGATSTFSYTVTDPSGLSTAGTATLAIGPDTIPPSTTLASLTVAGNSGATAIGIAAPIDPFYAASQLTITVTGLPSDGAVLLGDAVTSVYSGEVLTADQFSGLVFNPSASTFDASSSFTYKVTDPSGLSATGTATLAIGLAPNTSNQGISPDGSVIFAGSGGSIVTTAGTWTFGTGTSSFGNQILLNGQPAGNGYATELEINQGQVYADNAASQWWSWTGLGWASASNPTSPMTSTPSTTSTVATSGTSPASSSANGVDWAPILAQPSQAGDILGVRLQNTAATEEPSGYVTFGQVFQGGAVRVGDNLVARINGVNYAVQMDVRSTNPDGSIRQAILTLDAPGIAAGGTLDVMLAHGTAAAPSPSALSAAALLGSGYNVGVNFTFHNPDGTTTAVNTSAAAALQAAINAGTVQSWLSGPEVNEYDVVTTVNGGKLKVEFDIRAYANGTTTTDVIFDNSWMFSPGHTDLNYDVSISQGGQQVYSASGVEQYLYSLWDHQVASAGTINPNIQYDVPYLIATGAVPAYDTSYGIAEAPVQGNLSNLNPTDTGPMGTAEVTTFMPTTGGRNDIGPQPNWTAQWLLSQSAAAQTVMMADGNASGSIPWHYIDESTGEPLNLDTYPSFGSGLSPANGWPQLGSGGSPAPNGDPWAPDAAHMPDLNYVPYLITGSHYELELLQAQANYAISSVAGYNTTLDWSGTVRMGFAASFINDPSNPNGNNNSNGNQVRAIAWEMRQVAEAAYLTPDSDPLKAYFTNELNVALKGLVQQYIVDNVNGGYGQLNGFIEGQTGPGNGTGGLMVAPWQQDFLVISLAEVAGMNIPQASAEALQMLQYMNNFVSGLFTNSSNGYNPLDGTAEWLYINGNNGTGAAYTSWGQLFDGNLLGGGLDGYNGVVANPPRLINWPTATLGGYGPVARAALADEITYTQSPQAIQAYGFVVSQVAYAFALAGEDERAAYEAAPEFSIMPRLPDGAWLPNSQMQIDVSGASTVTLTATGGDTLLAVVGPGIATLTGGTGTIDLLYGGSGPTTLNAGIGNDYLFGGSGSTTFVDNTGNNYMHGGTGTNTYQFHDNGSGHDTIANFNINSDRLQIAPNLNGDGVLTAAQLISSATVSNGNTVFHLSSNDDVTLLGINQPSTVLNTILIS